MINYIEYQGNDIIINWLNGEKTRAKDVPKDVQKKLNESNNLQDFYNSALKGKYVMITEQEDSQLLFS